MEQSGDNRAPGHPVFRIAIDVHRGNAASLMATIPFSKDWAEFAFLPNRLSLNISNLSILLE